MTSPAGADCVCNVYRGAGVAARWLERRWKRPRTAAVPDQTPAVEFIEQVAALARRRPGSGPGRYRVVLALVLRSVDLTPPPASACSPRRRRDARRGFAARRVARDGLQRHSVAPTAANTRASPGGLPPRSAGGARHRRLPEVEARIDGTAARNCPGHADGAPRRQAPGHSVRRDPAPVHVQDFPARHSPQMGAEGANVCSTPGFTC